MNYFDPEMYNSVHSPLPTSPAYLNYHTTGLRGFPVYRKSKEPSSGAPGDATVWTVLSVKSVFVRLNFDKTAHLRSSHLSTTQEIWSLRK